MEEQNTQPTPEQEAQTTPEQETQTTPEVAQSTTTETKVNPSRQIVIAVAVGLIAVVIAFLLGSGKIGPNNGLLGGADTDTAGITISINGTEIPAEEIAKAVAQAKQVAVQQGLDPNTPEVRAQIEQQVTAMLINAELLSQAAEDADVDVTDAQIDEQIAALGAQFGGSEAFQAQLETFGLSEAELREDIAEQIAIDTYLQATDGFANIEVTDEEVQEAYDSFFAQNPNLPAFEEISAQIKEQLVSQKQQLAAQVVIEQLRTEAEIEASTGE